MYPPRSSTDRRGRAALVGALLVLSLAGPAPAVASVEPSPSIAAEPDVSIVDYAVPAEMERGERYRLSVTVRNELDERVYVEVSYDFEGLDLIIFEEVLDPGERATLPFPHTSVEELERSYMERVEPGTYAHGFSVSGERMDGDAIAGDSVADEVRILESETESDGSTADSTSTADADDAEAAPTHEPTAEPAEGREGGGVESEEPTRGFFSNDPGSSSALDDPATLTWLGILVSIGGILVQLVWRQ